MSSGGRQNISAEEFKTMADLAGLGMTQEELDELKPMYDLHLVYINQLHSLDLGAEEMAVSFEPDWPS